MRNIFFKKWDINVNVPVLLIISPLSFASESGTDERLFRLKFLRYLRSKLFWGVCLEAMNNLNNYSSLVWCFVTAFFFFGCSCFTQAGFSLAHVTVINTKFGGSVEEHQFYCSHVFFTRTISIYNIYIFILSKLTYEYLWYSRTCFWSYSYVVKFSNKKDHV